MVESSLIVPLFMMAMIGLVVVAVVVSFVILIFRRK